MHTTTSMNQSSTSKKNFPDPLLKASEDILKMNILLTEGKR
jgi:hypothetical protein